MPDRCVVHDGGVGTGVEGVGEGQEGGQDPRNLSFFYIATSVPPDRQFLLNFS